MLRLGQSAQTATGQGSSSSAHSSALEKLPILALGGPPGAGKTITLANSAVRSRERHTLEHVASEEGLGKTRERLAIFADVAARQIISVAPTNDAVDQGCQAIADAASTFPDTDPRILLKPVRVCDPSMLDGRPHLNKYHIYLECAALTFLSGAAGKNGRDAFTEGMSKQDWKRFDNSIKKSEIFTCAISEQELRWLGGTGGTRVSHAFFTTNGLELM